MFTSSPAKRQVLNSLFQSVSSKVLVSSGSVCNIRYSYSAFATRTIANQPCMTCERHLFVNKKRSNNHLPIETTPDGSEKYSNNSQRIVDDGSFKSLFRICLQFLTNIRKHLSLMEMSMIGIGILATSTVVYRYLYVV
ncbi:hypothetical protein C9374_005428 [Naegleria lovaniensis]|uniref:Uncharacterized protein n=1 Tax=Naegleria lovaniensis TaxID=51637 RepID=A0AA88GN28_NAELO|nr:uncharacterized protein C9374_005428 [Naegleria lovaniensis]KAG2382226.1 hypothetical protein C9374_005428 [Naegleria lovaniensis]